MHAVMHVLVLHCLLALQINTQAALSSQTTSLQTGLGNSYLAGNELTTTNTIPGDLFAAGGRLSVVHSVGADAMIVGGYVELSSEVGQDLRAAGGTVTINGVVGGELLAAGGTVKLAESTLVLGPSILAGSEVILDGRLTRNAKIYANRIVLNGMVDGNAQFNGEKIEFGPAARIEGDLHYVSSSALTDDQLAKVTGQVIRETTPEDWKPAKQRGSGRLLLLPVFFLSMLATGFILYLIFPNAINGARDSVTDAPLYSLLSGLALLFTVPPVSLLLMLTVLGIPIGLSLFALYPVMLLFGYLTAAFFIGRKLANFARQPSQLSKGKQGLFLAAALLVLGIAGAIPILGWMFIFLAFVTGIGGWARWATQRYRTPAPADAR